MAVNAEVIQNLPTISETQATSTAAYLDTGGVYTALPDQAATVNIDRFFTWATMKIFFAHWLGTKKVVENVGLTFSASNQNQLQQALDQRDGFRGLYAANDPTELWSSGEYDAGEVRRHNGSDWYVNALTTTDTPGPETDWEPVPKFSEKVVSMRKASYSDIDTPSHANFKNYNRVGQYRKNGVNYDRFRIKAYNQTGILKTSDFGILVAASKDVLTFATDQGTTYDINAFNHLGVPFDSGYVTPADWTNATETINHELGLPADDLSAELWVNSDETGEQRLGFYVSIYTTNVYGSALAVNDDDNVDLILSKQGPAGLDPTTGGAILMSGATNAQYRLVLTPKISCGYIEVDVPTGTITSIAG